MNVVISQIAETLDAERPSLAIRASIYAAAIFLGAAAMLMGHGRAQGDSSVVKAEPSKHCIPLRTADVKTGKSHICNHRL